jgi:hypothetical protein
MYFLSLEKYLHETETLLSVQFSSDIFTILYLQNELFYLCHFHSDTLAEFICTYCYKLLQFRLHKECCLHLGREIL